MQTRGLLQNEIVFGEGEDGNHAFIIKSGKIEIFRTDPSGAKHVIATLGPGEMFGEMALVDDQPRTASAKAIVESSILVISKGEFQDRLQRSDKAVAMMLSGANRASRSHLKIRFAFIEYRCATCATETPSADAWRQIKRFSSADQIRRFTVMAMYPWCPLSLVDTIIGNPSLQEKGGFTGRTQSSGRD